MSLVSLDDSFYDHPKALEAGEEAADVFVRGLAYCRRYNTDGRIPKAALVVITRRRKGGDCASALVRVALWHDAGDAWTVHDYETWYTNDPETKLAKQKKLAASRAKNYRDGRRDEPPRVTLPSRDASRDANVTITPAVTSPSRVVTRDEPSHARGRVPNSDTNSDPDSLKTPDPSVRFDPFRGAPTGDEFAAAMAKESDGAIDGGASADLLMTLQNLARGAKPKALSLDDFGLIGEAVREGGAGTWRNGKRFTIGWVIRDGGKVLFDLLAEARQWSESVTETGAPS